MGSYPLLRFRGQLDDGIGCGTGERLVACLWLANAIVWVDSGSRAADQKSRYGASNRWISSATLGDRDG